ncbi:molybdopterin-guanine dinucleotide biosynthesis protein MobA [Spirochaetia bacterium]|nr:molybdopterin-guanine dinucleotide biosynthesis protein MobA [Spirochaetia bacterium]
MYLSVNKVQPLYDYKLELTFENNEIKIFDVKPYLDTGVFKTLKDENFFKRVKVSYDTIEWPNGIDLDPEVLYEKSEMKNKKIL